MNYIIKGTSRCGKTMLTNLIVQNLVGYNKLSTDNLIGAFNKCMPKLEINHNSGKGMKELFPAFVKNLVMNSKEKDNKIGLFYVLEGVDISNDLLEFFNNQTDFVVICLGKPQLSREEYFKQVRCYENKYLYGEWTKRLTDQELLKYCDYWIKEANQLQTLCKEKGYLFFDTSFNQEKVINNVFKKIKANKLK